MTYADYLFRLNQKQAKYSQNRKDIKFILNVLYIKKEVYRLKKYKNLIKGLIQVLYEKVNKEKTSYQAVYRKIKEKTSLYIILKYLVKNDKFNYDFYITDIMRRKLLQWLELEKNKL